MCCHSYNMINRRCHRGSDSPQAETARVREIIVQERLDSRTIEFLKNGDWVHVQHYISKNHDRVNRQDQFGSLLHYAAYYGLHDCVYKLLVAGADVNLRARNNKQRTPLHLAALMGNREAVESLVINGASIEAVDQEGKTPLQLAKQSAQCQETYINRHYTADHRNVIRYLTTRENKSS